MKNVKRIILENEDKMQINQWILKYIINES